MDDNPINNPYCEGCKYYEPIGFYGWERKMYPETSKCKHLKRCGRVWKMGEDINQITISDYLKEKQC
jgi:hypothetical protein